MENRDNEQIYNVRQEQMVIYMVSFFEEQIDQEYGSANKMKAR